MKKIIALLLTFVMVLGLTPTTLAINDPVTSAGTSVSNLAGKDGVLKILSIGNSFSEDSTKYLYQIFQAYGYEKIELGYMYIGSCTLKKHVQMAESNSGSYDYYYNPENFWRSDTGETLLRGVTDQDWDIITMHAGVHEGGFAETFDEGNLDKLVDYVNANKTNPDCKLVYNLTWSLARDHGSDEFVNYWNRDSEAMYQGLVNTAKAKVATHSGIDFIIPTGTAIQNARSSYMGETMHYDGVHLSNVGRLIAGYTWFSTITGETLDEQLKFTACGRDKLSSADRKVIAEAVNNAIKTPFEQTVSSYTKNPTLYTVTVDGLTSKWEEGDCVSITAVAAETLKFKNWEVVRGGVTLKDAKSVDTTFIMPANDVEVKATYHSTDTGYVPVIGLEAGFCRVDVTPVDPQPLAGYGNTTSRMSNTRLTEEDGITVTANVLSDAGQTNIIFTTDFIRVPTAWGDRAKADIAAATGVPAENIHISATHTHASIDIGDRESATQAPKAVTSSDPYFRVWLNGLVDAAEGAMADLAPVSQIKTASVKIPNMSTIRHWRAMNGFMIGVNFKTGAGGAAIGGNAGTPRDTDATLRIIRFVRPGDEKKDVVFLNWAAHPTVSSTSGTDYGKRNRPYISACYPGFLRREVEARDGDCLVSFFLNASGNVNARNSSTRENWVMQSSEEPDRYAHKLADYTMEAMKNMAAVKIGPIESLRQKHVDINYDYGSTREIEQDVITIGKSIAFATAGYEMFDINAMDVMEASPYEMTFVLTCGGGQEYMPSWETWHYELMGSDRAYEAKAAQCNVVQGTAEDLAYGLIGMLNKLYKD